MTTHPHSLEHAGMCVCVSECACVYVCGREGGGGRGEGGEGMIKRKGKADKVGLVVYDRKGGTVKALHLLS